MLIFDNTINFVKPNNPSLDYRNPMINGLGSAILFQEGTTTPIDIANQTVCSPQVPSLVQTGPWGPVLNFNNNSRLTSGRIILPTNTPLTIICRIKLNATAGGNDFFCTAGLSGALFRSTAAGFTFWTNMSTGGATSAVIPDITNWHIVAATWDGIGSTRIYYDGDLIGSNVGGNTGIITNTSYQLGGSASGGTFFNGSMDFSYMWTRVLSGGEIQQLQNNPYGLFLTRPRYFPFDPGTPTPPPPVTNTSSTLMMMGVG